VPTPRTPRPSASPVPSSVPTPSSAAPGGVTGLPSPSVPVSVRP
jgi:hypothetical protein